MWIREVAIAAITAALLCGPSAAQDDEPEVEQGEALVAESKTPWTLSSSLSFSETGGNTETESLGVLASFRRDWDAWAFMLTPSHRYSAVGGETTQNQSDVDVGLRRTINDRWSLIAIAEWQRAPFKSIDGQIAGGAGVAWDVATPKSWDLELLSLAGWTAESFADGLPSQSFATAIFGFESTVTLSKTTTFAQHASYFRDLSEGSNHRLNALLVLTSEISTRFALEASYSLEYDHEPVIGLQTTDRILSVGIKISFTARGSEASR